MRNHSNIYSQSITVLTFIRELFDTSEHCTVAGHLTRTEFYLVELEFISLPACGQKL
jgi:hypothetical protein